MASLQFRTGEASIRGFSGRSGERLLGQSASIQVSAYKVAQPCLADGAQDHVHRVPQATVSEGIERRIIEITRGNGDGGTEAA